MRWLLVVLLWGAALAQVKNVTFVCEPADAAVYLESSGSAPYYLGACNRALPLDAALLQGKRNVALTFRREGWFDDTRVLPEGYFDSRDRYPDVSQGAVRLTPRPDLPSRLRQAGYYARAYWFAWPIVLVLGGVGLARWRGLQRQARQYADLPQVTGEDLFLGKLLGGYRLVARLGMGGMASVYKGVQEGRDSVAIKIMHPQYAADSVHKRRFKREVEIYRNLSHRNILKLYDFGESEGLLYLVVELLEGDTLKRRIAGRRLMLDEVLRYSAPLADALDYAHAKGVVHRDLKPENVFLCENGRLVVMDFGIAFGDEYTQATATGQGLGTPAYMAPEQVQGKAEPASDLYSFGIMLYEMFSGDVPFDGEDPLSVAFMHVGQQPPHLGERRPDLPASVVAVVHRLLAKDPRKRYASFAEAVEALKA